MQTIKLTSNNHQQVLDQAVAALQKGELVIYPTETIYGLGVVATDPAAVNKLLQYKSRREGKPLSIAVSNPDMAAKYVMINDQAKKLYQRFLPGPITVISQGKNKAAPGVESEFGTLGIRIPDYQLIRAVVKKLGKPITATSANASGKKRPYTINDILDHLSNKQKKLLGLIIDAGKLPPNQPSTVIDTTLSTPVVLREGQLSTSSKSTTKLPSAQLISHSEQETQQIAGKLMLKNWEKLKKQGLVIGLDGPLGAGKTIFAKGVAKFLHIKETITSPTYSYLNEYDYQRGQTSGKFYHLDAWKLQDPAVIDKLQLNKLVQPKNILVVEWWEQIKSSLPHKQPLQVSITESKLDHPRILKIAQTN
ncbi:MAG: threonylcarbamoyl-AMP synthase [Candidatus Pacebacteria bacterium]|nr:threonylcarbamoyl-AMP synthase [Candidatus Paceibacterota bacterium]